MIKKISEYMSLQKAKKVKETLEAEVDNIQVKLEYVGYSREWKLNIENKFERGLSFDEKEIIFIITEIIKVCKRYYCSFSIARYGTDNIYISVDVKQ